MTASTDDAFYEITSDLIPLTVRRIAYALVSALIIVIGAVMVGMTTVGWDIPDWVTFALTVLTALAAPLLIIATTYTRSQVVESTFLPEVVGGPEDPEDDLGLDILPSAESGDDSES